MTQKQHNNKDKLDKLHKSDKFHMQAAHVYAGLSYCKRRRVGCLVVKGERVISIGYNGTPPRWKNECEDEHGETYPYVYHAESNAISKVAISMESSEGARLYVTTAPCFDCAKLIAQTGITSVYYDEEYKNDDGLKLLKKCRIAVRQLKVHSLKKYSIAGNE